MDQQQYPLPSLMDPYPPMMEMGEQGLFSPFEPAQIYPFDAKYLNTEEYGTNDHN